MLFFANYFIPFILNFLATCMIYIGILFMSTKLLPSLLYSVYDNTSILIRTAIAVIVLMTPANVLVSYVYKNYNASTAGITNIIAVVLVLTIVAVLVDNIKVNMPVVIALMLAICSCSFLLFNLTK